MSRSRIRARSQRLGAVMIWVAILLPVIIIFTGFTTDLGIVYMAQAELQATADAAALAAGNELPGRDPDLQAAFIEQDAIDIAVEYAEKNLDPATYGTVLKDSDVELGTWDKTKRTFTSGTTPYNGVRVTCRRERANSDGDNSVPIYFLRILGVFGSNPDNVDLTAEAVALSGPKVGGEVSGGIVGKDWVKVGGSGLLDGFDPSQKYGPNNRHLDSGIQSNGYTYNYGTSYMYGSARSGPGQYAGVGGSATVTGDVRSRHSTLDFESISAPTAINAGANDNGQIVSSGYNSSNKSFRNGPQDIDALVAGEYYFSDLDIKGTMSITGPATIVVDGNATVNAGAEISVDSAAGPVTIYVEGKGTFNGQGITNVTQDVYGLTIYGTTNSPDMKWNGGSDFYGYIYAPDTPLTINGSGDYYGGGVGKTAYISGTGNVHADAMRGFPGRNDPLARLVH